MGENMADVESGRKRGNRFGFWFFKLSIKLFGLRGAYGLLYFVCAYYLIFDRESRHTSIIYIKRRFSHHNFFQRAWGAYKILINQGKNLVDRYYLISGAGKFDVEVRGYDKVRGILSNSSKGLLLLTAHVGNWQVTMNSLGEFGRSVRLLMRPEDNVSVRETLDISPEGKKVNTISTQSFLGGVLESVKALDNGDLVSIMGDRSYGANSVEVNFLGGLARLPYGAFSIAASVGCPVVVILSAKISTNKYMVDISNVIETGYTSKSDRKRDITGWVQKFADILENFVEKYPYQWFLFHDIWAVEYNGSD